METIRTTLSTLSTMSISATACAKLIRRDLKVKFPGVKFSVRSAYFSQGSSVDVSYTDGPSKLSVLAIVNAYGGRGFNSSDDSSTFANGDHLKLTAGGPALITCHAFLDVARNLTLESRLLGGFDPTKPVWDDAQPNVSVFNSMDFGGSK